MFTHQSTTRGWRGSLRSLIAVFLLLACLPPSTPLHAQGIVEEYLDPERDPAPCRHHDAATFAIQHPFDWEQRIDPNQQLAVTLQRIVGHQAHIKYTEEQLGQVRIYAYTRGRDLFELGVPRIINDRQVVVEYVGELAVAVFLPGGQCPDVSWPEPVPPVRDHAVPTGWFYSQTAVQISPTVPRGFTVTDDAGVRFWSEFQRLGGVQGVGYPVSQRFVWDGFVSQAFQKMVFQWRPEAGQVYAINVVDLLHEAGTDDWLLVHRATPPIADWSRDAQRSWPEIVAAHQALLTEPDIRAVYYAVDDPELIYGLPMAPIQNMGNVLVLRMQRGIIQKWLVETPWAAAGQVTIANSGDVAKEVGLLPATAIVPGQPPGGSRRPEPAVPCCPPPPVSPTPGIRRGYGPDPSVTPPPTPVISTPAASSATPTPTFAPR